MALSFLGILPFLYYSAVSARASTRSKTGRPAQKGTVDWREERRRRKSAAHTAPTGEAERPAIPPQSAAKTREEPGSAASASYPGDESLRRSYPGDEDSSKPGIQVGARERRIVPAGHGFRVSATVDDAASESEQNGDEHQRRLREAAAPRARRSPELSDDETRKRRRSPTQDRGRRTFGSRQLERLQSAMSAFRFEPPEAATEGASRRRPRSHDDGSWEADSSFDDRGKRRSHGSTTKARAALNTSRQRQRWVHQLGALEGASAGRGPNRLDRGARSATVARRRVRGGGGTRGSGRSRAADARRSRLFGARRARSDCGVGALT